MALIDCGYVKNNYGDKEQFDRYYSRARKGIVHTAEKILIKEHFDKSEETLDVGTGCGRFAIGAYRLGYKSMHGIDMHGEWIKCAQRIAKRKGYHIDFSEQNAMHTEFPDNMFRNIIFTSEGFAQVPGVDNRIQVLKEMLRILKEGGIFIFTTPDLDLTRQLHRPHWDYIMEFKEAELWKVRNFPDKNDVWIPDGGYMNYTPHDETRRIVREVGFELVGKDRDALEITNGVMDVDASNVSHYFVLKKGRKTC